MDAGGVFLLRMSYEISDVFLDVPDISWYCTCVEFIFNSIVYDVGRQLILSRPWVVRWVFRVSSADHLMDELSSQ